MFVVHRSKYIPWCKKKWNRVPSKSWMRNCRKITTYAYINRLAFFQRSRNCSINKFMCIIQVIHHSLKNSNHNIIIINKNNSQASKSETKIIYKAHTQTLPLSCLQSEVSSTYVSLSLSVSVSEIVFKLLSVCVSAGVVFPVSVCYIDSSPENM